jgi:hypothetical protein
MKVGLISIHQDLFLRREITIKVMNTDKILIRRIFGRRRLLKGYAIAFCRNNEIYVGYSLWDGKSWGGNRRFDRELGRVLARARAVRIDSLDIDTVPFTARPTVVNLVRAAIVYYKQANYPHDY